MQTERIIKQIKLIFWVIWSALLAALITILIMRSAFGALVDSTISQRETLKSIILILSLGGIPASYFFHSKKIKYIRKSLPMSEKLKQFRISFFIKIATLEALTFLALLGHLLTADFSFIYIFALLFIAYSLNMPSKRSIFNELEKD